jgi:hypothetical protein
MIADAAKSKMARKIVLRRQTGMDFTGPLGLVACAKRFLAVFLSIFSGPVATTRVQHAAIEPDATT